MEMPIPGEGVWLVNWVLEGGHWGVYPILHTKTCRTDLISHALALAEALTKNSSYK